MNLNYAGLEISELTVLNQFVVHLPSNILTDIDGHLKDLQNSPTAGRIDIVKKLIECLRTRTPDTLDEFIGYVAFATAISLIKNQQLLLDKYGLILHTFESRCFDHWNDDLIKVSPFQFDFRQTNRSRLSDKSTLCLLFRRCLL